MNRLRGLLVLVAFSGIAFAANPGRVAAETTATVSAPEMNPASALSALTLLSGAFVVLRGRRRA